MAKFFIADKCSEEKVFNVVELDPQKRIMVIIDQLRKDIIYGPCSLEFKLKELDKFYRKAVELSYLVDDFDRQQIEKAFPLTKELEELL